MAEWYGIRFAPLPSPSFPSPFIPYPPGSDGEGLQIWTCSAGAAAVVFIKNPFSICTSQESNPGHIDGNGGVVLV